MFSWGRRSQKEAPANKKEDSYSPLLEQERIDTRGSELIQLRESDSAKFVQQFLLDCDGKACTELLQAVAVQRPEPMQKAALAAGLGESAHRYRAKSLQNADTVVAVSDSEATVDLGVTPQSEKRLSSPIVQFTSGKYFCVENEDAVEVEVLRLNCNSQPSEVTYRTVDRSAIAGKNYVEASGRLVFTPGEVIKKIRIKLIDDAAWCGVLEFHVVLEEQGLVNAVVSEHSTIARVQRIDDDVFPTNKFKEQILARQVHEINAISLFIEYFRLCLQDPVICRGTIKMIAVGQLKNMFAMMKLFANIYLVDHVLATPKRGEEPDKWLVVNQHWSLVFYIMLGVIPLVFAHLADFAKFSWKVGGTARMGLSKGLVNAFLHLDDSSRAEVDEGLLNEAMTHDAETLIKMGYANFLAVFALIGQIVLFVLFQVAAPLAAGSSRAGSMILQMALFPLMMGGALVLRLGRTRTVLQERRDADRILSRHVHDIVNNLALLKDYNLRYSAMDRHEDLLRDVNAKDRAVGEVLENNKYLMKWLTFLTVAAYVLNGGISVINGDMRLGLYLTMSKVFVGLGAKWTALYQKVLQTFNSAPALERLVHFINLPSESRRCMQLSRDTRRLTLDFVNQPGDHEPGHDSHFNTIPIKFVNVGVTLRALTRQGVSKAETRLFFDDIIIQQGTLVSLVGQRGHGKSTLLKMLGGAHLPDCPDSEDTGNCMFFLPSHLRFLHVATESMFLRGSLYQNLTYGTFPGHPDGRVHRVKEVCRRLSLSDKLIAAIDPDSKDELSWSSALSSSEKHLLCMARALIANPDVLCIHKPTLHVNAATAELIVDILREFVDHRGIEQKGQIQHRRPRTCILTSTRALSMDAADAVFKVDGVDKQKITKVVDKHVSLEELC